MKKFILSTLMTVILISNLIVVNASALNIQAHSYILMDSKSGQVLYEDNADTQWRPASTTKIMTAILALENGKLDQMMTASTEAVYDIGDGGSNIGIMPGEVMSMEDLLNALLIRSANEAANIIAENICPTRKDFIDLMNKRAVELGALNTHFVNPCGKDDAKADAAHLSTAHDLALIARHAMTLPEFRKIVSKKSLNELKPTNKHSKWDILRTTNQFLVPSLWDSEQNNYTDITGAKKLFTVNGVKTGYTGDAGNNLVSSAVGSDGMEIIAVVFGVKNQGSGKIYSHSNELLKYGFNNFSEQKIIDAGKSVKTLSVTEGANNNGLEAITSGELKATLPNDKDKQHIKTEMHIEDSVKAPVKKGDILGYIEYKMNNVSLGKVNVIAAASIEKSMKAKAIDTAKKTVNIPLFKKLLMTVIICLAALFILRSILRRVSKRVHLNRH